MVVFKNWYMVLEMVFGFGFRLVDVKINYNDVVSVIYESFFVNFGEYGFVISFFFF